jgi:DNA-binding CsgD family transcriptional regulator
MSQTLTLPALNYDATLTDREDELVGILAMAHSTKEVPDLARPTRKGTPLSTNTVDRIKQSIYRKIGAQKAPEITIWWFVRRYNIPIVSFFLMLFISMEFAPIKTDLRARRSRRGKDEYEFVCENFDFTEPNPIPVL